MYIWLGVDLDSQLAKIKKQTLVARKKVGLPVANESFPMHLSFKISFWIEDDLAKQVIDDVCNYYKTLCAFDLCISHAECHPNIAWIRYAECQKLNDISIFLNDFLLKKYNVPLHEYDNDFVYHSTLFMDDDQSKVANAYQLVQNCKLPKTVRIDTFCVGCSQNGDLYSYNVCKRIKV